MNVSILDELRRFTGRSYSDPGTVNSAIERADLVRLVHARTRNLESTRLKRDDDVTDAQLKLAAAEAALEDFDREAGRASA